ncbi:hypothetical protein [Marinobacter mobilis]|uniref:Uncharacterized protein n=1 Tax=Marinobacter mobilis TaxID=488533 RepID=A0A1H2XLT1_9GAMM|nr:hypothetical protein [Marinobacter mobilis]SDW93760.1 hypothetical protein SAMN04487960_10595 [Marinobacter mobilis]
MLYDISSPAFTFAALMVLGGVVYSAKTFFDRKIADLNKSHSCEAEA